MHICLYVFPFYFTLTLSEVFSQSTNRVLLSKHIQIQTYKYVHGKKSLGGNLNKLTRDPKRKEKKRKVTRDKFVEK